MPSLWTRVTTARILGALVTVAIAFVAIWLGVAFEPPVVVQVALQVVALLAGGIIGNLLTADRGKSVAAQQASAGIRHLLAQAQRMQREIIQTERRAVDIRAKRLQVHGPAVADWLEAYGRSQRNEIDSIWASIDDWGHLSPEARTVEMNMFNARNQSPPPENELGE
ncbi:hypothetical protein [Nocardioides sp. GY 10127]|uniref:hypothetical protein n=1 Tax=Nocardioides sp. GY 10127 TaxID=2569762 RepID=UPI0010A8BF6F|nr:hypothetical protein [Nocardioides sp. GY 10127]